MNGISCFGQSAHTMDDSTQELPPVSDTTPADDDVWYFLKATSIVDNPRLLEFFQHEPEGPFCYKDKQCAIFLSFRLPADTDLPENFVCHFDNKPEGHYSIARSDDAFYDAEFCRIGEGGCYYATVPALVNVGWLRRAQD
jgi:hypothetical protein